MCLQPMRAWMTKSYKHKAEYIVIQILQRHW